MILLTMVAAGFAAYGPPDNHGAYIAVTNRVLAREEIQGLPVYEQAVATSPMFPSEVTLERCVRRQDKQVKLPNGAEIQLGGYDCIIEIWPNAAPSYRTTGFFHHDGFEWNYYGPVSESNTPSISAFTAEKTYGGFVARPGSTEDLSERDNAANNRGYNPYREQFESLDCRMTQNRARANC